MNSRRIYRTIWLLILLSATCQPVNGQLLEKFKQVLSDQEVAEVEIAAEDPALAAAGEDGISSDAPTSPEDCPPHVSWMLGDYPEACGTGQPPRALDPRYITPSPYEGHWSVEFRDSDLMARAYLIITNGNSRLGPRNPQEGIRSSGIVQVPGATVGGPHGEGSASIDEDGSLQDVFGKWGYCNCHPLLVKVRPSGDPDVLTGKWIFRGTEGVTIWRRRPAAQIQTIIAHAGVMNESGEYVDDQVRFGERPLRIERDHPLTCGYGDMRANCPSAGLSVRGTNFAGGHDIWMDPADSTEIFANWECRSGEASGYNWHGCGMQPPFGKDNTGLQITLLFRNGIRPGPRTLWVDGHPIPIDLTINNFPEEPAKPQLLSLRVLDGKGAYVEALSEGLPFMLKASFSDDHPDDWVSVAIPLHASNVKELVLYRSENPREFSSRWVTLEASLER